MNFTVSFPGLGINNIEISRKAFTLFGIDVYWYGLLIAFAVLLTLFLAVRQSKPFGLSQDDVLDTYLVLLPMIIIFARLYYVVFSWHEYSDNLLSIFDTRRGGLAFYGGVIGGILAILGVSYYKGKKLLNMLDFFAVYLPLGQAIGRWGNFFNQEAFGTNTTLPWGMISNGTTQYLFNLGDPSLNPTQPVHPTFLYEFLGNLLIFALLLFIRKRSTFQFETGAWYLLTYGALRFFVESIRTDALFIGHTGIRVSMLLSAIMVICALVYLAYGYRAVGRDTLPAALVKDWDSLTPRGEARRLALQEAALTDEEKKEIVEEEKATEEKAEAEEAEHEGAVSDKPASEEEAGEPAEETAEKPAEEAEKPADSDAAETKED